MSEPMTAERLAKIKQEDEEFKTPAKDTLQLIGRMYCLRVAIHELIAEIERLQGEVERLQRASDGWEHDALIYAQNAGKYEAERDEARKALERRTTEAVQVYDGYAALCNRYRTALEKIQAELERQEDVVAPFIGSYEQGLKLEISLLESRISRADHIARKALGECGE